MRSLLGVAVLLVVPASLAAQTWQQGVPVVSAAHAPGYYNASDEALAAVRARLRELADAQEEYFLANRTYTTNLSALRLPRPDKGRAQVVLTVTHAGGRMWRATGRHTALQNRSCAIFVGGAEDLSLQPTQGKTPRPRADQEGVVVCDAG